MTFAVDIETIPDLSMVDLLPEVKAAKNLKDPAKIEADIKERKAKQIADMAVNPLFAKIICIGLYKPGEEYTLMGDEKEIIDTFWRIIGKSERIVTFNGISFDMDVIIKRGLKHGRRLFQIDKLLLDKRSGRHIDLMNEFCQWGQYEKLDTLAKVYLGKKKIDVDFNKFPEMLETPEGRNEIAEYCLQDCKLTYELGEFFGYNLD